MLAMKDGRFGVIGLGTMGRNFLVNVARSGVPCIGYDLDPLKVDSLAEGAEGLDVFATESLKDLFASIAAPRSIMLFVPADLVDQVIEDCIPFLEKGDLLIDGGNSHYSDTERRAELVRKAGGEFLGVGVSGGEEGARNGACIMIGGDRDSFERVREIFVSACARVGDDPCCAFIGAGSAGHFVKMVHNGIEYGMMQVVCEAFDFMQRNLGMSCAEISEVFRKWNEGRLDSFLIEISSQILRKTDSETGLPLVELILDTAAQKGTGKWTSQAAMDFGVAIPTIDAAVSMRQISAKKELRMSVSAEFVRPSEIVGADRTAALGALEQAVYGAFLSTYAQGFALIRAASAEKGYDVDTADVARIWRGGCIIRSAILGLVRESFVGNPDAESLLLCRPFAVAVAGALPAWRETARSFIAAGIPCMGITSALGYVEAVSSDRLPANLLQAQRDLFGAHTYRRTDREGSFHTKDWK